MAPVFQLSEIQEVTTGDIVIDLDMIGNSMLEPILSSSELFNFSESSAGGVINLHVHSNSFRNAGNIVGPVWLTTNLTNTEIKQNSTTLEGLNTAINTGGGSLTATALSTSLI